MSDRVHKSRDVKRKSHEGSPDVKRHRDVRRKSPEGPPDVKRPRDVKRESPEGPPEGGPSASTEPVSKPSFVPSGKLAADTNTFKGTVIKYNEPDEAAIPKTKWRFYPMKDEEVLKPLYIHRQSAFLIGRDRKIADFPVDHPSCSKQHAVLQYRSMPFERNGVAGRRTLPYIIDLESGNGTYLNGNRIDPRRYYELKEKDVIKFGFSSREYVLLHEQSDEGKGNLDEEIDEDDEIDDTGVEEKMAGADADEDYF